jgi:HD-GYP domain-containing protein (c-di-GMP phosphodiesterase class II)
VLEAAAPSLTKEASHQVATQIPSHHRSQRRILIKLRSSKRRSTWEKERKNENIEITLWNFLINENFTLSNSMCQFIKEHFLLLFLLLSNLFP